MRWEREEELLIDCEKEERGEEKRRTRRARNKKDKRLKGNDNNKQTKVQKRKEKKKTVYSAQLAHSLSLALCMSQITSHRDEDYH